jgi:hypothetical protein
MSAVELVHEDPGETDSGDPEFGQRRARGSARPDDVDRALDTPDDLTDQRLIREALSEAETVCSGADKCVARRRAYRF